MLTRLGTIVVVASAIMFASAGSLWAQLGGQYDPLVNLSGGYGAPYQCGGPAEEFGTCLSANTDTSNGPEGSGTISYSLGSNPFVSLSSYYQEANGTGGSSDAAALTFYVAYCVDPACSGGVGSVNADITYNASLTTSATTGPSGDVGQTPSAEETLLFYQNGSFTTEVDAEACAESNEPAFNCPDSRYPQTLQLGSDISIPVSMLVDTVYVIEIQAFRGSDGGVDASFAPTFSVSGGSGTFEYSPGITGPAGPTGVPEPASLLLVASGLVGLRLLRRRISTN
jgi:hypothetical protein